MLEDKSTQSRKDVSDGKESRKATEGYIQDGRRERGILESQGETREKNGGGSRVQGVVGGTPQKAGEVLGTYDRGFLGVSDGKLEGDRSLKKIRRLISAIRL